MIICQIEMMDFFDVVFFFFPYPTYCLLTLLLSSCKWQIHFIIVLHHHFRCASEWEDFFCTCCCSTTYNWTSFGISFGCCHFVCMETLFYSRHFLLCAILIDFMWCWSNSEDRKTIMSLYPEYRVVANFPNCSSVTHKFHHRSHVL